VAAAKPKAIAKAQEIREAVDAELKYDSGIDSADITVKNMSGDVALNGTVPSYPQTLRAGRGGARGPGRDERSQPPAGRPASRQPPR
jgi:hypothetical protein